jgi:hypothetical protein
MGSHFNVTTCRKAMHKAVPIQNPLSISLSKVIDEEKICVKEIQGVSCQCCPVSALAIPTRQYFV